MAEERRNHSEALLDPLNPRLPEADHNLSQRELIATLIENDDVYDLACSIVEKGYYPLEPLIALDDDDGKRYIIEGNRRLAALKLLLSPTGAPETHIKKFKRLSERIDTDQFKKVDLLLAPSRMAAAPLIMSKHTKPEVQIWKPLMKAKFYQRLVQAGQSIEEIAKEDGTTPSEVARFLQSYSMYQVACTIDFPEDVKRIVGNPRVFPMSTLERIYRSTPGQKFLHIEFGPDGRLIGKVNPDEFRKGYSKLVSDVATGGIDSRTANDNKAIAKYLNSVADTQKPDSGQGGRFSAESLLSGYEEEVKSSRKTAFPKPKARAKRRSAGIIPPSIHCNVNSMRIKDVFTELKKLRVSTFRNSVAVMFRTFLEMSVSYYLDETGKINVILEKHRAKGKPTNWYPSLRQMLHYMLNEDPDISLSPLSLKALRKHLADNESFLSIDSLDSFVHNRRFNPAEDHLRSLWEQFEELFAVLLMEPEKPE